MKAYIYLLTLVLTALISAPSYAYRLQNNDWTVDIGKDYTEAFTNNATGSILGTYCDSKECFSYFEVRKTCEQNQSTPLLINSKLGAIYTSATCFVVLSEGKKRYVNKIVDSNIVQTMTNGDVIGIAIPLVGGEFQVSRFSLKGYSKSINALTIHSNNNNSIKDTYY